MVYQAASCKYDHHVLIPGPITVIKFGCQSESYNKLTLDRNMNDADKVMTFL
jgi:hypothetical protein